MHRGVVKWFNDAKGFGFIRADGFVSDVFAHYSAIDMDGFKCLRPGMVVQFRMIDTARGLLAQDISLAPGSDPQPAE
jgi:cold shock protein